ncbi:MAG TPA: acetoacetate decarboxylase family protein [Acidimicrobiales bacterium]|nr:acetoacetate decarboxylase family protein [Acidimicrobiales bacterium]
MDAPPGPWSLAGELVVALVRGRPQGLSLPAELHRVPGPGLLVAARYDESPVGPYLELALSEPARLGARLGMCVTTMVVTTSESRLGGRANWGFPKELGTLEWSGEGAARVLRWQERGIVVRGTPMGPPLPTLAPTRMLQRRADGPVAAAARLGGRARTAKVEVSVPEGDPWTAICGAHLGAVVSGARLVMGEARPATTPASPRRHRSRVPEPALSWESHQGD